jgi:hypothetical protein
MEDEMSNVCERKVCSLEEIDNEAKTFHDEVQQWYAKKGHDKTEPVLMYYRGPAGCQLQAGAANRPEGL